jgi:hypothetical protein
LRASLSAIKRFSFSSSALSCSRFDPAVGASVSSSEASPSMSSSPEDDDEEEEN